MEVILVANKPKTDVQQACNIIAKSIKNDRDWRVVCKVLDNLFHGLSYGYTADGVMKELFKARNKHTGANFKYLNWPDLSKGINFFELQKLWKVKQEKPTLRLVKNTLSHSSTTKKT